MKFNPKTVLIGVTSHTSVSFHRDLANELYTTGWKVHVVSAAGPRLSELPKTIRIHEIKMERNPHPARDLAAFGSWLKLLSKVKPSLVIVGTPKASLLGGIAAKITRVPSRIYFVHGLRLETSEGVKRKILKAAEIITARCSTSLVAVSRSLKEELEKSGIAKADKITVLGSGSTQGVDLSQFRPPETKYEKNKILRDVGFDPNVPTIGFVGRLTADKGIAEFREAVTLLHRDGVQLQALVVGSVEDECGKEVLADFEASGVRFHATGHIWDTAPYFRGMDIFCLPSYREGLGNVILEAFASRVPVIGTQVTGITDLIEDMHTGVLIPPKDAKALADAIQFLLDNPHLRKNIAAAAGTVVEEKFDAKSVVQRQVDFLQNL